MACSFASRSLTAQAAFQLGHRSPRSNLSYAVQMGARKEDRRFSLPARRVQRRPTGDVALRDRRWLSIFARAVLPGRQVRAAFCQGANHCQLSSAQATASMPFCADASRSSARFQPAQLQQCSEDCLTRHWLVSSMLA